MTFEPAAAERSAPLDFTLRTLDAADAEEAAEVIRASFSVQSRETSPPSGALSETTGSVAGKIAGGGGFGVVCDGRLVAVLIWQIDSDAAYVGRVSALPAFRGHGLTRRLMEACEAAARGRGARRMRLRVRLALPKNERLFQQFGFARCGLEAHPGCDAPTTAVMEKRLS